MSIKNLQKDQQSFEVLRLQENMGKVEAALLEKTPDLPIVLAEIHKDMLKHEELVHIMDDEDIAILHRAFETHKHVVLLQKETDKQAKGRGRKKLTEKDLTNL